MSERAGEPPVAERAGEPPVAERAKRDEARFAMGPAILFCPADRPERFGKAAERADAVILDLEDAVAADAKEQARANILAADLDPERTIVRVNPVGTDDFAADLAMLRESGFRTLMLAKTESPADVDALLGLHVIALLETVKGVFHAGAIAAQPNVVALMWGSEDLVASMGGHSSRLPDRTYRDVVRTARATVAIAAAAHDKAMLDAVFMDIKDLDGLRAEADDAAACGFAGSACIHPSQVDVIRAAFAPTDEQRDWAARLLAAADAAGNGVFAFEGRMVDEPILRHARTILSR